MDKVPQIWFLTRRAFVTSNDIFSFRSYLLLTIMHQNNFRIIMTNEKPDLNNTLKNTSPSILYLLVFGKSVGPRPPVGSHHSYGVPCQQLGRQGRSPCWHTVYICERKSNRRLRNHFLKYSKALAKAQKGVCWFKSMSSLFIHRHGKFGKSHKKDWPPYIRLT